MSDLDEKNSSQSMKITGASSSGTETNYVDAELDANGKGRLLVDADLDSAQLVPTITNKFRINYNTSNVVLPGGSPGSWVTLFTRSGTGLFFGFQAAFNNDAVDIRLTLDSGVVFLINLNSIRQFQFNDTTTTRTQMGGFLTTIGNVLDFSSKFAIPYESNVTIEARSASGGAKTNTNWVVFGTEDS
jgi:hypothetical protein